jgi:hypothetical protein
MLKKAKVIYYLSDVEKSSQKTLIDSLKNSNAKFIAKDEEGLERLVSFCPPGTIFAQSYDVEEKSNIVCLPIMSSHISLPLKQGEFVWYMSDDNSKSRDDTSEVFSNHPLLAINNYWISRVHGSLLSEDLNYSYKERDALVLNSKLDKTSLDDETNMIIPDFKEGSIFTPDSSITQEVSTKSLYEEGRDTYFGDKATPRMFSKTDDLTIQGSYNTLLNLTSTNSVVSQNNAREGLIDIVSGRLALQDFTVKDDKLIKIGNKTITNLVNLENKIIDTEFNLSSKKYLEITNASGGKEIFKTPEFYLNEDIEDLKLVESNIDYMSDASRVMISESINIDNDLYYDLEYLEEADDYPEYFLEDPSSKLTIRKDYLKNSVISIRNASTSSLKIESFIETEQDNKTVLEIKSLPTIFLKSNNIRIVSRKMLENDKNKIPGGSIRLVKEGDKFLNYSHILMENDGNISIEGSAIKIGDFRKEFMKINNIRTLEKYESLSENSSFKIDVNNDLVKNMHGNGYGVLLGYEKSLSEPLVLGNTLIGVLSEVININVSTLNEIHAIADLQKSDNLAIKAFADLVQTGFNTLGIPIPPLTFTSDANYTSVINKAGEEIQKLEKIKNNLTDILSRFTKTS